MTAGVVCIYSAPREDTLRDWLRMPPVMKTKKQFDFSAFAQRRIALKVMYCGWNYHGLAYQGESVSTVERALFEALERTRLIQSPTSCEFSRCGRTDKGVSSSGQVISLSVRSRRPLDLPSGTPFTLEDDFPVVSMLNATLPMDIRVLAVCDVASDFHARHSCTARAYIYHLPWETSWGKAPFQAALQLLLGVHDFRNFAKLHEDNLSGSLEQEDTVTVREMLQATCQWSQDDRTCAVTFQGTGFLYHQVRNMISILTMIAMGVEGVETMAKLLDPQQVDSKPVYDPAPPEPLTLVACGYGPTRMELPWSIRAETAITFQGLTSWMTLWSQRIQLVARMMADQEDADQKEQPSSHGAEQRKGKGKGRDGAGHHPLLKRPREMSLSERLQRKVQKGHWSNVSSLDANE